MRPGREAILWARRTLWRPKAWLGLLLLLFCLTSVSHLGSVPVVHQDEPWIASAAWKLASQGVLGTDLFTGLHGMEQHAYHFLPVFPIILAAVFKVFAVGLLPTRLLVVAMALAGLLLTYAVAARLSGPSTGMLAVGFLLFARLFELTPVQVTGIPWIDFARIGRYDFGVALFGLAGLHLYLNNQEEGRPAIAMAAGAACGLAALSNAYGILWFVALLAVSVWQRRGITFSLSLCVGLLLMSAFYALFVLPASADWHDQLALQGERFQVLNLDWYWHNLSHEFNRYATGTGRSLTSWVRPGIWLTLLFVPLAFVSLVADIRGDNDGRAQVLVVTGVVLPLGLALLVYNKSTNYTLLVLPIMAIMVAGGVKRAWTLSVRPGLARWLQTVLVVLLFAVLLEGLARHQHLHRRAAEMPPYAEFIARVQAGVPPDARVLGLHRYWFGFEHQPYRSWAAFLIMGSARIDSDPSVMVAALDDYSPDIVLLGPDIRGYFTTTEPAPSVPRAAHAWLLESYVLQRTVLDDSYGLMEIFVRKP